MGFMGLLSKRLLVLQLRRENTPLSKRWLLCTPKRREHPSGMQDNAKASGVAASRGSLRLISAQITQGAHRN